jgi:3-oxoacyl-[acyl-carrier protein] reductase
MSPDDWKDVINTNLEGVFNICKLVSFSMIKNRSGSIINMSSVSGVYGNIGQSNYAASKAGIIGFSKSLAKELGPFGIRVNVVAPGIIDTDMVNTVGLRLEKMIKGIPLRAVGTPKDVAMSVDFLASDRARYITGQTLGVDGGLVC